MGKRLVTNFILADNEWMDVRRYVKTKGKGGVKMDGSMSNNLGTSGLLFDVSYWTETSELLYWCVSPQF